MTYFKRFFHAWDSFWFAPTSPYSMAAFRIAFGAYLLIYFLRFLPNVSLMFSTQGVYSPFLVPDYAPAPLFAWLIYAFTLAVIAAFTLGYKSRIVNPLLLAVFMYHWLLNLAVLNCSFDRINIILLIILLFVKTDAVWSVASGWKDRTDEKVSAWPVRLIQIQIALIISGAGFWKVINPNWHEGEMMLNTLQSSWATPFAFSFVSLDLPLWVFTVLTWSVIIFECLMGPALYLKITAKTAILAGTLFHLSIWLFLDIPEFLNCVPCYLLFLKGEEIYAYKNRIVTFFAKLLNIPLSRLDNHNQPKPTSSAN